MALLKAGTNLATKSAEELIDIDAKSFELNGNQVRVAQVNTVDINEVLERRAEIEAAMTAAIQANGYSDFVLMITDILNSNSEILALGANMDIHYYAAVVGHFKGRVLQGNVIGMLDGFQMECLRSLSSHQFAAVWDFLNESVIDLYNGIRGGHCHINSFVGFQCGNNVIQNPLAH